MTTGRQIPIEKHYHSLEFCYKNRTPRSDPTNGGLCMGYVAEVDLEKNSQSARHLMFLWGQNQPQDLLLGLRKRTAQKCTPHIP